jgi:hypothetical protein
VVTGYKHAAALFPPQPGDAFEYDDFQNFADDFRFTGDAAASFSPPLACPRCALWDTAPQPIGFEPVTGYTCQVSFLYSSSSLSSSWPGRADRKSFTKAGPLTEKC